ncbi:MAG: protein kinase [Alphaproteobacteria bacterium]|nr:protein kinase [Alphaproteobacteria bacterium]
MAVDNVQALPPGTELGDYRLDAIIGHGSFGITYRAFDKQLAKFVAIKEYLPVEFAVRKGENEVVPRGARYADDFTWGRERFLDEARALARFRHPHIVPVLRYFEANGTAYTVMEFEDGQSLAEVLRSKAPRLPAEDVRRLASGLLSGLAAVHAQSFLHRDIKPSNIIIRRDGVPVLIDFGAARLAIGERTQTLTGVLTPQYAPIEQYSLDSKQGPWSDIYSAAAVLYHAIIGKPPPDAAARVGVDPYLPLADTERDRFDALFLAAIDRGLAFAPDRRPQSVEQWSRAFGTTVGRVESAPTQRLETRPEDPTPRLGGVSRGPEQPSVEPAPRPSRLGFWLVLIAIAAGAIGLWRYHTDIRGWLVDATPTQPTTAVAEKPTAQPATPAATPAPAPSTTPSTAPAPSTAPRADNASQRALIEKARQAALEARAVYEKADEAARTAISMAGEARIVAARAARPDLERADSRTYEGGASYIGQVVDGKRQGLGVAELADGEKQAGDWQADRLNGLGTVRFPDDTRYAGQLRDGMAGGLGVRERPGVERLEGTFVAGRFDGLGVRRSLAAPSMVQTGEFRADKLEGPGVETVGEERYEGGFRNGRRSGYGQITGPDGRVRSGRWADGKPLETTP